MQKTFLFAIGTYFTHILSVCICIHIYQYITYRHIVLPINQQKDMLLTQSRHSLSLTPPPTIISFHPVPSATIVTGQARCIIHTHSEIRLGDTEEPICALHSFLQSPQPPPVPIPIPTLPRGPLHTYTHKHTVILLQVHAYGESCHNHV